MDEKKSEDASPGSGISEAERMAKIRELLIGPALADESARMDRSVSRLDEAASVQRETVAGLQSRLDELEVRQSREIDRLQTRLLGLIEALLADEEEIRARLMHSDVLRTKLRDGGDQRND